jgi:zinc and cadmium transporter
MSSTTLLIVYCLLIVAASLAGGRLSSWVRMTHLRTQLLMSGVGGLMIGIALLHLLPHGAEVLRSNSNAGLGVLIGLTVMFLLIRLFHTHDHSIPVTDDDAHPSSHHDHSHHDHSHHDHSHDDHSHHDHSHHDHSHHDHSHQTCEHGHHHGHDHGINKGVSWAGLFFGLLLHTLVDGVALASSVMADTSHTAWMGLAGLGTFLAVILHKPLDAFAITSVMKKQKWTISSQNTANFAFSLACPIGAMAFYFGATLLDSNSVLLGWGLVISSGFFVGIALADLLPEVAFHDHDRGKLTFAFLAGIAIAVGIENLPGHSHNHNVPTPVLDPAKLSEPLTK